MSGRDTGSSTPGNAGGAAGGADCSQLRFDTFISSPLPSAINKLMPGVALPIDVFRQNSIETVAVYLNGTAVGGIVDHSSRLLKCITNGFSYEAIVLSKNGAQIAIRIEPA